jgi:heat shock protein HtpX
MFFWTGGRSNRDDEGGSNPLVGLLLLILAPILALIIQMAISRSREYLADETGAALCGNPHWLAGALARLEQGVAQRPFATAPEATSHMFIVHPFSAGGLAGLFSTHPPMRERIDRLMNMRVS